MKKILILVCVMTFFIIGCSNTTSYNKESSQLHPLFSNDSEKYFLLVVDDTNNDWDWNKWRDDNKISNVKRITVNTFDEVKNFKFLELEKSPAYVVFDKKGVVFKTYKEQDLIHFLNTNTPN